jgi:hypothetical protein
VSVTKTVHLDAANQQLHRLRCTFSSAGAATVVELVGGTHLPAACVLAQVHGYNVTGTGATYQLDVHEAAAGLSSVPAGAAKLFEGTSTAKADQSNTSKIGGMVALDAGRSLYVRLQPASGTDNAATVDVYIVPTVGGV